MKPGERQKNLLSWKTCSATSENTSQALSSHPNLLGLAIFFSHKRGEEQRCGHLHFAREILRAEADGERQLA